jgi:hypothetical protein
MAAISKLTVRKATPLKGDNWLAVREVKGKDAVPGKSRGGDCIVEVTTSPHNNATEWKQIQWSGGKPVPGRPNQRRISRGASGKHEVEAVLGASRQQAVVWILWADIKILTSEPRPAAAKPWSEGAMFTGPDRCGAFEVDSFSMGKNARGQVIAVAQLLPQGVGKVIGAKYTSLVIRRQVTAHDFVDGNKHKHKKSFVEWADDTLLGMQVLKSAASDKIYDTDGPDLPSALKTAETYNNFRQWVEWDGQPCSGYARWYFQAQWKDQKVVMKDVGQGKIKLPPKAQLK